MVVETVVKAVILVVALVILVWLFANMVPAFGKLIEGAFNSIKAVICENIGWAGFLFGC